MKVSDVIHIMQAILKKDGDVDVLGECEECTSANLKVYILSGDKDEGKCWILVSSS